MPLRMLVIKHFIQEVMNLNFTFLHSNSLWTETLNRNTETDKKKHRSNENVEYFSH